MGAAPIRIAVMTSIDGVRFDDAWSDRIDTRWGGQPTSVLSPDKLITNKRATGRAQDRLDADRLERERP